MRPRLPCLRASVPSDDGRLNRQMRRVGSTSIQKEIRFMMTWRPVLMSLALLAASLPGIGGGLALAHDEEEARSGGPGYDAGYPRGYQHGYRHGYHDAVSGLGYETRPTVTP